MSKRIRVILLISNLSGRWDYHRDLGPTRVEYPRQIPCVPLGHVVMLNVEDNVHVFHMICAHSRRSRNSLHPIDYTSLLFCIEDVNDLLEKFDPELVELVMPERTCRFHGAHLDRVKKMLKRLNHHITFV